jgi:protein ImuB
MNDSAAALGIKQHMSATTARALAEPETPGSLLLLERDVAAEQYCLEQLCCWAYSITPTLCIHTQDSLQLEIGGCLKLFGGLNNILTEISLNMEARAYRVEYGLASTPKAAWLLSFAGNENALNIHCALAERLAPLPLSLLEDLFSSAKSLHLAGLRTLGDIFSLPSAALTRRCGKDFSDFLQQLLGQRQDILPQYLPPRNYVDKYLFGYEVKVNNELLPAIKLLLQSLCRFLRNTQLRTDAVTWQLISMDSQLHNMVVRSSSSNSNWESWFQLTQIQLENQQLKNSVEGLSLTCEDLHAIEQESIDLFSPRNQSESLGSLLDRLRSRLGLQAIEKISCRDEHLPEFALHLSNEDLADNCGSKQHSEQRPFWLLPQPQAVKQHGKKLYWNGALRLIVGPERIEDNWWQEAVSRDYYIAANNGNQHYWIFRDRLTSSWFIHGIFV